MTTGHRWRWAGLAAIAVLAALFASFNTGERVALNLGFTMLYRIPLVPLIFLAFLAGMVTMFLIGLRHDLRVRRALREAGFGEPIAASSRSRRWEEDRFEPDPGAERTESPSAALVQSAPPPPPRGADPTDPVLRPEAMGSGSTELPDDDATPTSGHPPEPPPRDPP